MGTRGLGTVLHLSFADQLVHAAVDVRVPAVSATLSTGGHVSLRGNVSKTVANPPHKKSPYVKGRSDIPPEERSTAAKRQRYGGNISPFIGCRQVFPSGPMGSRQSPPQGPWGPERYPIGAPRSLGQKNVRGTGPFPCVNQLGPMPESRKLLREL